MFKKSIYHYFFILGTSANNVTGPCTALKFLKGWTCGWLDATRCLPVPIAGSEKVLFIKTALHFCFRFLSAIEDAGSKELSEQSNILQRLHIFED